MNGDVIISGRGLCRYYQRGIETVRALDGVDIDIRAGEAVCVLGPSGSGKTTLINLLSALDGPTAGTLAIDGRRVDGLPEHELVNIRRGTLGYVFQKFHLIPTLTVAENVALPLLFLGKKPDPEGLAQVLDSVGLADRATHLPKELSGGQMQRVAIGRALIARPRVLIADEPTGNLDRQTGETIFDLFIKAVREKGVALVLTTHNLALAATAEPERLRLYGELQEIIRQDCPWIFVNFSRAYSLSHRNVINFRPHDFPYGMEKYLRHGR